MFLSLLVSFLALTFSCSSVNASGKVDATRSRDAFNKHSSRSPQREVPRNNTAKMRAPAEIDSVKITVPEEDIIKATAKAVIPEEDDSLVDKDVLSALHKLEKKYPLDPEKDLGGKLKTYLKGTQGWDNYLKPYVEEYIERAKNKDVEALAHLGSSFKNHRLPCNDNVLIMKLLIAASLKGSVGALSNLSDVFKKGLAPIKPDKQAIESDEKLGILFYNAAIKMPGNDGDRLREFLNLPPLS
ncbi:MAG: hypothetical protein Q8S21_06100 [Candidatus Paracaedibacteraceae bacterium]|nr:hypothetical protein [Candidatus Paracaedibacteraceae bacterium]